MELDQIKSSPQLKLLEDKKMHLENEKRHIEDKIQQLLEDMAKHNQKSELNARLSFKKAELKRKQELRVEK
jgi:hypothetical protein